jgi:hypothetical protein
VNRRSRGSSGRSRHAQRRPKSAAEQAVDLVRGLSGEDPLTAELVASSLLAVSRGEMADEAADRAWADLLVATFQRTKSADGLAILFAIRALLPPTWREPADAAIAALMHLAIPSPPWAAEIDAPRPLDAWAATDEYGDQTMVGVGFRHGAWLPNGLQFMVDRNFEGLVRQAMVAPRPDAMLQVWSENAPADLEPHATTAQEAADRLAVGIGMFDLYLDPPVDDDVRRLMPLLRARLRQLPPAVEPREEKPVGAARRRRLARDFARSDDAPPGIDAELLASYFIDYGADWSGGDPLRWSPVRVELLLMDWFPRKVALADQEIAAVPVALRGWVRWAARHKGISSEGLAETLAALDEFGGEFVAAMHDEESFGPAKSLARAMLEDGIDVTDEAAVQRWIGAWNAERLADTVRESEVKARKRGGKH